MKKNIFIKGPVLPLFIAESITKHSNKKEIGAFGIFLGQVRNDLILGKEVKAIEYNTYPEMAETKFNEIRVNAIKKYSLSCVHLFHSIGRVNAGEISLFVLTASMHRKNAQSACREIVERIKREIPVWGKEIFDDETYVWKKNN